jgi:hypothetical protein
MTAQVCGFMDLCFWASEPGAIIIAGLLAAGVAIWGYGWQQRYARADARAAIYGEALRAVEDYAEAPYVIRRRSGKYARAEVTRQISEIQSRLSLSCALLEVSANQHIAEAYVTLVKAARREAGAAMSDAWKSPRIRKDSEVTGQRRYDRFGIDDGREKFLAAIREHDGAASRHVR